MSSKAFFILAVLFVGFAGGARRPTESSAAAVEDIYVARSWREQRQTPTPFCSKTRTSFSAAYEDRYTLRSIDVRAADGLVVDADVKIIGSLRACFGPAPDSANAYFYAEGEIAQVSFTGTGECIRGRADFPESGIRASHCFLQLRPNSPEYRGGQLTTNSVTSQQLLGGVSDPKGYTQPSIATIRLWKH